MTLSAGTRIGPYETISHIGSGGMGEVYLARDTQLKRDVALKVLPDTFASDPDRMARFQREAEVLGSLNHANIAHIYGIESHALVMEYVEGQTLPCPVPGDVAVEYARQIAEALEYAHERAVIHRDLKPANVKVTAAGVVKLLDFGLAKALDTPSGFEPDVTHSPTLTLGATRAGVIMGTAAYMSPEQANGKPADRRADIWSFGAVLFEMLAGTKAFDGESASDTLASVLKLEPNWKALPATTPPSVRRLLERCLTKDRRQRLQSIGEARIVLDQPSDAAPASPPPRTPVLWPALAIVFALLASGLAFVHLRERPQPVETTRMQIALAEGVTYPGFPPSAISPDGRKLAYFANGSDGKRRLWIRPLDSLETKAIAGSEIDSFAIPIWSPDSRNIAYAADGKLRRIAIAGGPPTPVSSLPPGAVAGGAWNHDDVLLIGSAARSISRVSATGGTPSTVVRQGLFPAFLPDGRHFVYLNPTGPQGPGLYVGDLEVGPEAQSSQRLNASFFTPVIGESPDGRAFLLFPREGTLLAQPFDAARLGLTGEPTPIAEHVGADGILGAFSASHDGTLVYFSGATGARVQWYDRQGKMLGEAGEGGLAVALSPDATRAAMTTLPVVGGALSNVWLLDLSRGGRTRFSFSSGADADPVWSAEGRWIAFASRRGEGSDLFQKASSGAGDEQLLLHSNEPKSPTSWSSDGRYLLFTATNPRTNNDVWVLPMLANENARKPIPLLSSEFNESHAFISPDSRWLAYISDASGRNEAYVRPFVPPGGGQSVSAGALTLVSSNGAETVRWRRDGKELFYEAPDGTIMAVEIAPGASFQPGTPQRLFQTNAIVGARYWDVSADGKRFLVGVLGGRNAQTPFTVVLNWQAALGK